MKVGSKFVKSINLNASSFSKIFLSSRRSSYDFCFVYFVLFNEEMSILLNFYNYQLLVCQNKQIQISKIWAIYNLSQSRKGQIHINIIALNIIKPIHMQKQSLKKRDTFAVSIRKEQKQKIFQKYRKNLHGALQYYKSLEKLIQNFDLKENQKFSKQRQFDNIFILFDLLLEKRQNLIAIQFKDDQISKKIEEQTFVSSQRELEIQEISLPKQYPLSLQTFLFDCISNYLYFNPQNFKSMNKQVQRQIIDFWIRLLKRNKYSLVSRQKQYHLALLNCLELFVCQIQQPQLRKIIFSWVEGTESLTLIYNCLHGEFLNIHQYGRIYEIIIMGFKHKDPQKRIEAVDVLLKSIQNCDYDDITSLLQHKSQLFTILLRFFYDEWIFRHMHEDKNIFKSIIKAAYCVNGFLSNYDKNIYQCLLEGAGYIGAFLICNREKQLMLEGLLIFRNIASIEQRMYSAKALKFLTQNSSIKDTGVWQKMAEFSQFAENQDIEIKKGFIQFIKVFFANAGYYEILQLNRQIFKNSESNIVNMLTTMLETNYESSIQNDIISCFLSLLYYSGSSDDQAENQQFQEQQMQIDNLEEQKHHTRLFDPGFIIAQIKSSRLIQRLQQISNKQAQFPQNQLYNLTEIIFYLENRLEKTQF